MYHEWLPLKKGTELDRYMENGSAKIGDSILESPIVNASKKQTLFKRGSHYSLIAVRAEAVLHLQLNEINI